MTQPLEGLSAFVEVFWKSGIVLGPALCLNGLLRNKSADLRRLVLSTSILALFVAAIAMPALPRWATTTPAWFRTQSRVVQPTVNSPAPVAFPFETNVAQRPQPGQPHQPIFRLPPIIPSIWILGTLLFLTRFATSLRGLRRLRNASDPVTNGDLLMQVNPNVTLLQNETVTAPVTWGILRPVILLPTAFEHLPAESRNTVLCHESAHIRAHDFTMRTLAEIARAALWFQPLIWIARRQLRIEQELACDNHVVASGNKPSTYAKLLMNWSSKLPMPEALIAVGMAQRSCLKQRLYALLAPDTRREALSASFITATLLIGIAAALPLAALDFATPPPPPAPAPPQVVHAVQPPLPEAPIELAQLAPPPPPTQPPAIPRPADAPFVPAPPPYQATTNLVQVDAQVFDQNGKVIEGLKADDFALTEDGKPQAISIFEFQKLSDTPLGSYYVIGYYSTNPKSDGGYRKTGLTLKSDPTAKLDFRAGYYATKSSPPAFIVDGVTDMNAGTRTAFPVITSKIDPEYSEQARKAKYSGTVTLDVGVDAEGRVTSLRVIKSLGMGLDEKAMEAVTKWKFQPGTQDGKPIPMQTRIEVIFRLL